MPPKVITVTVPNDPIEVVSIQLPGAPGPVGPKGDPGQNNVLTIGTVTTRTPGTTATATISGVSPNQVLNLGIPSGLKGDKGDPNVLTIGTVTTLTEGQAAVATITGTSPAQVLNLQIPRGYGVRPGGLTGDVLVKLSATDHDTGWETPTGTGALVRKGYADAQDAATLSSANGYTDTKDSARKTYVDTQDAATLTSANSYTDTKDAAQKTYIDNADTALSGRVTTNENTLAAATSAATANTIAKRDVSGNVNHNRVFSAQAPASANELTRKDYVDTGLSGKANSVHTHLSADVTDAASAATASKLIVRDVNGRAQVADPSVSADIATKNYVDTQKLVAIVAKTAAYTFTTADAGKLIYLQSGTASSTFTIPTNAAQAFPVGSWIDVMNNTSNTLTIAASVGVSMSIDGFVSSGGTWSRLGTDQIVRLIKTGTDAWYAYRMDQYDTGWISYTPLSPMGVGTGAGNQYRVKNGICYVTVDWSYNGAWTNGFVGFTFPANARPSRTNTYLGGFSTADGAAFKVMGISSNGNFWLASPSATFNGLLGFASWPVGA
jgi:hypothetical protein